MSNRPTTFLRRLGLFDATMLVISGIIGSGIFINPYLVAQRLHTPVLIFTAWILGGCIALTGALVFAELSSVLPRVGGPYAYFREAFHPLVAFLQGWSVLLLIQSSAIAAVAVVFAQYLLRLLHIPPQFAAPIAVTILISLSAFHGLGIKPGAALINVITVVKTIVLGLLIAGALFLTKHSSLQVASVEPLTAHGSAFISTFLSALVPVMFAYTGWQNLSCVSEEVLNPHRNLPRAILMGVICVIVIYVSINIAYVHVLSAPGLAATHTPAATMAAQLFGEIGAQTISLLIVISTFGFINLSLLSAPRVYYAMAADGLIFRSLAHLSPRYRSPTRAIWLQSLLASALALTNTYDKLLVYAVFADWITSALAGIALIILRRKMPEAQRPYPTPLYPFIPLLFSGVGAAIVANLFMTDTRNALSCSVIILLGVPVYFVWSAKKSASIH